MTYAPNPKALRAAAAGTGTKSTRRNPRVIGPFETRRGGAFELPLRVHGLNLGGCLIESHFQVDVGRRIPLEINVPGEGWVTLQAETLYPRQNFGFAVKFVDMDVQTRVKLARAVLGALREQKLVRSSRADSARP